MRFFDLFLGAATVASVVLAAPAASGEASTSTKQRRKSKFSFTGVNQSGAEFGNKNLPGQLGKDYTWPAHSSIDTLIGKGMTTFRIPIMMERVVPTKMTGTVNETYFQGLNDASPPSLSSVGFLLTLLVDCQLHHRKVCIFGLSRKYQVNG